MIVKRRIPLSLLTNELHICPCKIQIQIVNIHTIIKNVPSIWDVQNGTRMDEILQTIVHELVWALVQAFSGLHACLFYFFTLSFVGFHGVKWDLFHSKWFDHAMVDWEDSYGYRFLETWVFSRLRRFAVHTSL